MATGILRNQGDTSKPTGTARIAAATEEPVEITSNQRKPLTRKGTKCAPSKEEEEERHRIRKPGNTGGIVRAVEKPEDDTVKVGLESSVKMEAPDTPPAPPKRLCIIF